MDAEGNELEGSEQQEGAVWIVAEFDDDEYKGDTYLQVSLDSVSLTDSRRQRDYLRPGRPVQRQQGSL